LVDFGFSIFDFGLDEPMRTLATYCAIFFAAFLVLGLPLASIAPDAIACVQSIDLQAVLPALAMLAVGLVATAPEERLKEIRGMKSPKLLRESVSELNKEIQKHRDKINDAKYEWRQEDQTLMETLFSERSECLNRAEFLETAENVFNDIERSNGGGGNPPRQNLRQDPEPRGGNPDGPLTPAQRDDAQNWAIARTLGVRLSAANSALVKRAAEANVFRGKGNSIDVRAGNITQEFRDLQRQLRQGRTLESLEARALTVNTGASSAGFFGTSGFIAQIERIMLYFGPMLQVCRVLSTNDGRAIDMPTVDDTANTGREVAEEASVATATDPTIGEVSWLTRKIASDKVLYSAEAEEDSVLDLFSLIVDLLGERLARRANALWTLGGTNITGVVPGASAGVTVTSASVATPATNDVALATALIGLINSVDIAYQSAGAVLMCNQVHLTRLATLQDSAGRWMYSVKDGMLDSFKGRPIKPNNNMVTTLAAGRPFIFGDFSSYWCRVVRNVRIRRMVELHSDTDQDAVQCFRRIGGNFANTRAVRALVLT
jgi:HK97 family phage major capsid protein